MRWLSLLGLLTTLLTPPASADRLPARGDRLPTRGVGARTLSPPAPRMVWLAPARIRLGSSRLEILEVATACNRAARTEACSLESFADELAGPEITVEGFWLDRREVSLGEYEQCVTQGRCAPLPYPEGARRFERPELPAVFVSWYDARAYCAFRDARLPTEAEFERAARGPEGRRFPWGEQFHTNLANHGRWGVSATDARDGYEELAPVESFLAGATPQGVLQLAGNVAEWTESLYAPYDSPTTDPAAPRVVRGGHYLAAPAWLRGAARLHEPPHRRAAFLGFRCARSAR